jgi:hypothetical protein
MSFLRKQQSQACSPVSGNPGDMDLSYFLDSHFRGNDAPRRLDSRLRRNDNFAPLTRRRFAPPASPARGEANCIIRLNCYRKKYLPC